MAHVYRVEVQMPYRTGIPRDVAINTFHLWSSAAVEGATGAEVVDAFHDFYTVDPAGSATALRLYMSGFLDLANSVISIFEVNDWDTPVGPHTFTPVAVVPTSLGGTTTQSLPLEVAICISSIGTYNPAGGASTEPIRNRRGRTYFGPLGTTVLQEDVSSRPVVSSTVRDGLSISMGVLTDRLEANATPLVVWSRKLGTVSGVTGGFINDEFDTQQRRGADETARTAWVTTF